MFYKEMTPQELNSIAEEKHLITDSTYQIDYNKAFVTTYKDKTGMLFPGNGGGNGIMFYDMEVMKKMIKEKNFPVKGEGTFWENEKERILHFDKSIAYYCSRLSELIAYNVHLSNDSLYLKELSRAINKKLKLNEPASNIYQYVGIYIGELLRIKKKGQWKLHPIYTLNIYYIPEIVCNKTFCNHWNFLFNQMEMASFKQIDIGNLINLADDFTPFVSRDYVSI